MAAIGERTGYFISDLNDEEKAGTEVGYSICDDHHPRQ
jgi:hypothetical protein